MAHVSVVIPAFNAANTVARAIDSALRQIFDGILEIIVVNDGSTDRTAGMLAQYEPRIRIINQVNQGPAAARNAGVAQSDGEFIAFLDADDMFMANKLAQTVPLLAEHERASLLFHDAIALDQDGEQVTQSYVWPERAHAPSMEEMLAKWWPIVPSTVVMRRKVFALCGGFCQEFRMPGYEDPDLWIRAREYGEFIYLPEQLTSYTICAQRAERMEKYMRARSLFFRRLRSRYGARAEPLISSTIRSYTNWLSYQGLLAMQRGDGPAARAYFMRILRHQPTHLKSVLRLLRTFLPATVARSLSGRTAGARRPPVDERGPALDAITNPLKHTNSQ